MIPSHDTQHSAEALALLTSMFKGQATIEGLLSSFTDNLQYLEDQIFYYLDHIVLSAAVGDVLDKYGSIVGVGRNGRIDSDYLVAIKLRIRILRSSGTAEDIIQCCALILASFQYDEWFPAKFTVSAFNVANPNPLLTELAAARDGGVRGVFLFSNWSGATMVWNQTGWDDSVAHGFPNKLVSSQDFTK